MSARLTLLAALALAAAPAAAQELDLAKMIKAPPLIPIRAEARVGLRYERVTRLPGAAEQREFLAIVGETEQAWKVETNQTLAAFANLPGGEGLCFALLIEKRSGQVSAARVGKVGGPLTEVGVHPLPPIPAPSTAPDRKEELALPSGAKVPTEVWVTRVGAESYTTWRGAPGSPLAGIQLKSERPGQTIQLKEDPSSVQLPLEDQAEGKPVQLATTRTAFDDGTVYFTTAHPVARAFQLELAKFVTSAFETQLVSLRSDAKPTLAWP